MSHQSSTMPSAPEDTSSASASWDAVVFTSRDSPSAEAFMKELQRRQASGWPASLKNALLLCVEDPAESIGSGAATLNALLSVAEHFSANKGFTVLTNDVFQGIRILIIHMGREFMFDPCGRGFTVMSPTSAQDSSYLPIWLPCNIDRLILCLNPCLAQPPGVWVASSDFVIHDLNLTEAFSTSKCFASTESINNSKNQSPSKKVPGAVLLAVPATVEACLDHGVFRVNHDDGSLRDIIYQGTESQLQKFLEEDRASNGSDALPLVAGITFFNPSLAEKITGLHQIAPLNATTYLGQDLGLVPVGLSLFFDFLLPLSSNVTLEEFQNRHLYGRFVKQPVRVNERDVLYRARRVIWDQLHGHEARVVVVPGGRLEYLSAKPRGFAAQMKELLKGSPPGGLAIKHSFVDEEHVSTEAIISNSFVGKGVSISSGAVVQHCDLKGAISIGQDCIISGLKLHLSSNATPIVIPDGTVFLFIRIRVPAPSSDHTFSSQGLDAVPQSTPTPTLGSFLVFFNVHDDINMPIKYPNSTFLGRPLAPYLDSLGSGIDSVLNAGENTTLWSWKTFPVLLSSDPTLIIQHYLHLISEGDTGALLTQCRTGGLTLSPMEAYFFVNTDLELDTRHRLFWSSLCAKINKVILEGDRVNLLPYFTQAILEGKEGILLDSLDDTAEKCSYHGVSGLTPLTRTLAAIADVLGCLAKGKGGLRSGPAGNKSWQNAFAQIAIGDLTEGIRRLAAERRHWMDRPQRLVRASRHYEGAAQILIRQSILLSKNLVAVSPKQDRGDAEDIEGRNHWIVAECPARLDLSGGWSDTPPMTYENKDGGGCVTNVAILIDQKRPIGAKVMRLHEPMVRICFSADGSGGDYIELSSVDDFKDFNQPMSPGALVKTALIFTGIVKLPDLVQLAQSRESGDQSPSGAHEMLLADQLMQSIQSPGLEIRCWSNLPRGSGLGTSSILAGALLATLYELRGFEYTNDSIFHAVLILEQMLTTGGGWQDQVGGLLPGFKMCSSKPQLPVKIEVEVLEPDQSFKSRFCDHLLLIYTGKTRLAKNILLEALRRWLSREPSIVNTVRGLVENAQDAARAITAGDLDALGVCMNKYWEQKKVMSPSSDPLILRQVMQVLTPHVKGQLLTGAGGGGFLMVLTKEPLASQHITSLIETVSGAEGFEIYPMSIDEQGMQVYKVASDICGGPVMEGKTTYIMA